MEFTFHYFSTIQYTGAQWLVGPSLDGFRAGPRNITEDTATIRSQLDNIQSTASKSFELLKEINYMDGIENIRSAHKVFFSPSSASEHGPLVSYTT